MNRELAELKSVLKSYQEEMESEKSNFDQQISKLSSDLVQRSVERDEWSRRTRELEEELQRL